MLCGGVGSGHSASRLSGGINTVVSVLEAHPAEAIQKVTIKHICAVLFNFVQGITLLLCFLRGLFNGLVAFFNRRICRLLPLFKALNLRFQFGGPISLNLP